LATYVAARLELLRIEAAEVLRRSVRRVILAAILATLAFFAWALVVAGGVGWLTAWLEAAGYPVAWYWVALGFGVLHMAGAVIIGVALTRRGPPAFATTMAEFEKDRRWLDSLRHSKKS